ncbi:MAG TPA: helix-turn-helix domain-containing protein, partial [Anaerolineae bacterium]|nr:helix-turn-helix domain-containing protein [Anaerolineae bacterium]
RMLAMFLARKLTQAAYSEIGDFFGGRNHSTVMFAEKKVRQWQALDEDGFKRKAMAYLSRRGFDYDVTIETVERAWQKVTSEQTE